MSRVFLLKSSAFQIYRIDYLPFLPHVSFLAIAPSDCRVFTVCVKNLSLSTNERTNERQSIPAACLDHTLTHTLTIMLCTYLSVFSKGTLLSRQQQEVPFSVERTSCIITIIIIKFAYLTAFAFFRQLSLIIGPRTISVCLSVWTHVQSVSPSLPVLDLTSQQQSARRDL